MENFPNARAGKESSGIRFSITTNVLEQRRFDYAIIPNISRVFFPRSEASLWRNLDKLNHVEPLDL